MIRLPTILVARCYSRGGACVRRAAGDSEHKLACMVGLRIFFWRVAFEAAQSQNREKCVFGEPALFQLAPEAVQQNPDLPAGKRFRQGHKDVWRPKIAVV